MSHSKAPLLLTIALLLVAPTGAQRAAAPPVTVLLGAFDAEVAALSSKVSGKHERTVMGVKFVQGRLGHRRVVVAQTGMGKVNAAMTTAIALMAFKPEQVVFSGIAGGVGPDLRPGDLVIGEKAVQHDYGFLGPDGFKHEATVRFNSNEHNPLFYDSDPRLVVLAEVLAQKVTFENIPSEKGPRLPRVRKGIIATGDMFIANSAKKKELIETFKTDAVEMEGAAVAQVCQGQNTPFIIIRSISDNADEGAATDVKAFYQAAAENSARFVAALAAALAKPH